MPADAKRLAAPVLPYGEMFPRAGSDGEYGGGGDDSPFSGFEVCLGGNRGGSVGLGAIAVAVDVVPNICPSSTFRRTGGAGKFLVLNPEVFARKGTGGGFGFSTASPSSCRNRCTAWTSSAVGGAPRPLLSGIVPLDAAAGP